MSAGQKLPGEVGSGTGAPGKRKRGGEGKGLAGQGGTAPAQKGEGHDGAKQQGRGKLGSEKMPGETAVKRVASTCGQEQTRITAAPPTKQKTAPEESGTGEVKSPLGEGKSGSPSSRSNPIKG